MTIARLLAGSLAIVLVGRARAEPPDDRAKKIAATRVEHAPTIDGRLDDEAWTHASPERGFTQNFPDEARPPSEATDLYLAYDDRALYVGIRCHDRQPSLIVERLTRRDRDTAADKVTIDIDSRHDHASGYHFDLNVSGVLADGVRFNDTDYNGDWDGVWTGAATRDDGGWTAELEIPWRTLRYSGADPAMGIQFRRYIQRRGEVDEWAYIPRSVKGEVSRYGTLTALVGLGPVRLFQVWPYLGARATLLSNSGAQDGVSAAPNVGVDLKLGLTSSLTLDATVNPDFGQVEADQVQLNLSTYEIFFPEKRPFFLEGVDLFGTPLTQFYTRRVGHAPVSPYLGPSEEAVEVPTAGRIWIAAKLSGQIVPHLSVAALDAVTAEQGAEVAPAPGTRVRRLLDPTTNYAVLRIRSDFGLSYFGITGTAVDRAEDRGADVTPCPNDLTPVGDYISPRNGRCTHDAYTAGTDATLVTSDGTWGAAAHAVVSTVANGPIRTIADGTTIGPGDTGGGLWAIAGKQGGDHLLFAVRYDGYSPKLDLNDAGYLRRANLHRIHAFGVVRSTKPWGPTVDSGVGAWSQLQLSWAGVRLWNDAGLFGWAKFKNLWSMSVEVSNRWNRFDDRETRDGAFTERREGWELALSLRSDPRRKLFGGLDFWSSRVARGASYGGILTLSVRPLSNVELDLIPHVEWTYGDPRWAHRTDTLEDGRRVYWFGDLTSQVLDLTIRGTYTFTPRLTLQLYAQIFVAGYRYDHFTTSTAPAASVVANPTLALDSFVAAPSLGYDYDGREGAINVNVVLRWEYLPGSTLIAVYTHAHAQVDYATAEGAGAPRFTPFQNGPAADALLLKLSYLWL